MLMFLPAAQIPFDVAEALHPSPMLSPPVVGGVLVPLLAIW
jgi:hypothetical protein